MAEKRPIVALLSVTIITELCCKSTFLVKAN